MWLHLNTAWHSFLGIITSHEARERDWGLLCAAHLANWLVSCHLLFLQIGKLSFLAGASELLSLLSWFLQMIYSEYTANVIGAECGSIKFSFFKGEVFELIWSCIPDESNKNVHGFIKRLFKLESYIFLFLHDSCLNTKA